MYKYIKETWSCVFHNTIARSAHLTMEPSLALFVSALATCLAFTNAADVSTDQTPIGTLYAYGQNVSGLPLFYADGNIQTRSFSCSDIEH